MEGKKPITISMSGFFLIITILTIAVMGVCMCIQSNNLRGNIADLEKEKQSLSNMVDVLQGKIDEMANTVSSVNGIQEKVVSENNSEVVNNEKKSFNIQGTYAVVDVNHEYYESHDYIFSGNKVTFQTLDTKEGSFKVEGNKIIITYNKYYGPEGEELEISNEKDELTIIDENTLTQTNPSTGYVTQYVKK